jgi:hypothetical protein
LVNRWAVEEPGDVDCAVGAEPFDEVRDFRDRPDHAYSTVSATSLCSGLELGQPSVGQRRVRNDREDVARPVHDLTDCCGICQQTLFASVRGPDVAHPVSFVDCWGLVVSGDGHVEGLGQDRRFVLERRE